MNFFPMNILLVLELIHKLTLQYTTIVATNQTLFCIETLLHQKWLAVGLRETTIRNAYHDLNFLGLIQKDGIMGVIINTNAWWTSALPAHLGMQWHYEFYDIVAKA